MIVIRVTYNVPDALSRLSDDWISDVPTDVVNYEGKEYALELVNEQSAAYSLKKL